MCKQLKQFLLFLFFTSIPRIIICQDIRINEFQALNTNTFSDSFGEFSDWIEIHNFGIEAIDLSGYVLTDDPQDLEKWEFPDITVEANSYLVVFASGQDIKEPDQELHTNFKLTGDGEYLAFISPDGTILTAFDPEYPAQVNDASWGFIDGGYLLFQTPTPGTSNTMEDGLILPKPIFNKNHGYYEDPFEVTISSTVEGVSIYYTTNGNTPSESNGILYTGPILIEKNAVLRAVSTKPSFEDSPIATQTYLFLDNVISQSNNPPDYPSTWGPYYEIEGYGIADYEMDREVTTGSAYQSLMDKALLDLPVMSIVTDIGNLFSDVADPETGGIYIYTGPPEINDVRGLGDEWERPASVEYFVPNGSEGFQIDCGIRLHGGHSRRVEKTPKHSFRLAFRSEYGFSKLTFPIFGEDATNSFNTLILRAGFGNSFTHHSSGERNRAQYIRDIWGKDTQSAMGHLSGKGNFVHLFLNGLYWGIYNPTERIDNSYGETYLGGNKEDFDIIKDYGYIVDGNDQAWQNMMGQVNSGLLGGKEGYQKIQGNNPDGTPNPAYQPYVDVVNLIDYMILNFYGGNWDWDHHNWVAVRNRIEPGKGFQFFSWDAEHIVESIYANNLTEDNANCPSRIFQKMRLNPAFLSLFADRIQKHFFNGGALTEQANINRWMYRATQLDTAIIAESARWGDYRRDVHPWRESGPFDLYTQQTWLDEQDFIINEYFPQRKDVFIQQLRQAGLFPTVDAPEFFINNISAHEVVPQKGDMVKMATSVGAIYFTTDGSDPRESLNDEQKIAPTAIEYSEEIEINNTTYLKARTYFNDEWSALSEFIYSDNTDLSNLKITEIHYHPLEEGDLESGLFEFIELKNTGNTPLNLSGLKFTTGIDFTFNENTILGPEKFAVIASSPTNFIKRYPLNPVGKYEGRLSNGGEQLVLLDALEDTVMSIQFDDEAPWPLSGDGEGFSIVPTELNPTGAQNDGNNWRASLEIHGSPGRDDQIVTSITTPSQNQTCLFQNYPNPAIDETTIGFQLQTAGIVTLLMYDQLGKVVKVLVDDLFEKGYHSLSLPLNDLPEGLYFYQYQLNSRDIGVKKMLVIK